MVEFHIPVLFENAHMREALIGFFVCPGWGWGGGGGSETQGHNSKLHQQLPGLRVSWSHVYLLIIAHFPAVHMQAVTAKMFKEGMRIEAKHVKK